MQAEALHCFGLQSLERREWTIKFTLIKEHVGNYGKEIADNLAKEATKNKEIMFNKIPKSQIVTTSETIRVQKGGKHNGNKQQKN